MKLNVASLSWLQGRPKLLHKPWNFFFLLQLVLPRRLSIVISCHIGCFLTAYCTHSPNLLYSNLESKRVYLPNNPFSLNRSSESPRKVLEKTSESPQILLRKSSESPQKVFRKSQENPRKVIRNSSESLYKVLRKSPESPQNVISKSLESIQNVISKSLARFRKSSERGRVWWSRLVSFRLVCYLVLPTYLGGQGKS